MHAPLDRGALRYTANYCEENVWQLAAEAGLADGARDVVLVTSEARATPCWWQRATPGGGPVIWDYHVFLVVRASPGALVYDLDTRLPFPCAAERYLAETFARAMALPTPHHPRFRVVDAATYRARFWSDRSHMRTADGGWTSPPPPWPPILAPGASEDDGERGPPMTLTAALDRTQPSPGVWLDLDRLARRYLRDAAPR
jgi:hypothetical protein